jgi:putative ABC transport system permease protein
MRSALARKSWTDLTRRPARAVLTIFTLALAVASFGILALPALMNAAVAQEVNQSRLYDVYIPVNDVPLSAAQIRQLANLPNVTAVAARSVFITRTLIGSRRVPTEVWGVPSFTDQPVDRVTTSLRPGPGQVLVDVRDSMSAISNAAAGDTLRVEAATGAFNSLQVIGSADAMSFNQDALTGRLILYATQPTVQRLGGFKGVNLVELRLRDARHAAAVATVSAVRSFLAARPVPSAFSNVPTIRAPGDWPLKSIFNARAKILDILIVLAVLSALFLLANTMRTLVAEQGREIGVMRSIGASARDVRNSYLKTAALLGLFGAVIGSVLGIGLSYLLLRLFARMVYGISPGFAIDWAVVAIGAAAGVLGAVLTAWPALRRVMHTPVHEALASAGIVSKFGSSRLDRTILHSSVVPSPLRIGVRNIARQKGRSLSTIMQVALAVATLLGLMSLALAVTEVTDQSWNVLDYDISLSSQPGGTLYGSDVVSAVRSQPGVAGVELADWYQMSYRNQTLYALGVHAHTFIREPLAAGRWLSVQDEATRASVAIVGSAAARNFGLHPGSRVTMITAIGPVTFTVIGIGASQANNGYNLYTTLPTMQALTGHAGLANSLLVRTVDKSHAAIDSVAARLEALLARSGHPSNSQVMYAGRATDQATASSMLVIVEGIGLLIVAISMLGLVNAITMSIIERTREIGVLRSLGARGRDLRRIFRTETVSLALIGFVLAVPLGYLLAHVLQWLIVVIVGGHLPAPFTLESVVIAFIGTVVLAVLVVSLPLRRATHLRPGEAIRYN